MNTSHGLLTLLVVLVLCPALTAGETPVEPPRLIVQITVDQLRGDLPTRYADRLGEGGFRYLLEQGLHYPNAHYEHATTETVVGHATLATGAHPAAHGMVANVWYDRGLGRLVYNIEDPRYRLLTAGADVDDATEIDPTQKQAGTEGRSPAAIQVSTFGDELSLLTAGRAKVFGVSVKDRGAVTMAGHAGTAYWFSKASGEFVTSTYYRDAYPAWVVDWNARRHTDRYAGKSWELLHPPETYLFGDADDQPWEVALPGFGRTFPHAWGPADGKLYTTLLTISPAGDELTLDFALELLDREGLGDDEVPDFLGISFSANDYVGHMFGPSSLENEDNLMRLDRTLARLFARLDERVGLRNTLIVLSADHGGPEAPGALVARGIESSYVDTDSWDRAPAIQALERRFGVGEGLVESFFQPYLYLDRELIAAHGLDQGEVERAVAEELMQFDGVALAVSSQALRTGAFPEMPLMRKVLNNYNPKRSGDVFVVFEPQRFINDFDGLEVASIHGSPWSYDTYVPILIAGAGVPAGKIHRAVAPNDIAPTLSALVGANPPSGSAGDLLLEVFERRPAAAVETGGGD
jgi:predicted AlkP superfamily pyrophosphatase or phosphodiesterase